MSVGYDIVAEAPQVRVFGTGPITMAGMIDVLAQVVVDPRFNSQFPVILDLREATYQANLADGDALVAVLRQKKTDFQNRFAVVVPESLHFLARLYCALAIVGGFEKIRCFTNFEEAQAWCTAQP